MSNEEEKITNENLKKIKPQSPCKRFKGKKLGKDEYWSPNLVMSKKIETIEEEFQDDEEEFQDDEPLTLINAQRKGHFS